MACNNCGKSSCNKSCCKGCLQQIKGSCVFYQGAPLTCIGVTKGDTFDKSLKRINDLLCTLPTPTGVAYTGQTGEITIVSNVIGISPVYTNTINANFTNVENRLGDLESCEAGNISNITTTTPGLSISFLPNPSGCGRSARINYSGGSTSNSNSGIILNHTTSTPSISTSYQSPLPFTAVQSLKVGDEVIIRGSLSRGTARLGLQSYIIADNITSLAFTDVHDNSILGATYKINVFEITLLIVAKTTNTTTLKASGDFKTSYTYNSDPNFIQTGDSTDVTYVGTSTITFTVLLFIRLLFFFLSQLKIFPK